MSGSDKADAPVRGLSKGQRLTCSACGAEIEIVAPCTCVPPDQSFVCCDQEMVPGVDRQVNLGVE